MARYLQKGDHNTSSQSPPYSHSRRSKLISNLFTYCKVGEKIICEIIVEDMIKRMDPAQFRNMKNTSQQHYLISLLHRITSKLDKNSKGDIFQHVLHYMNTARPFRGNATNWEYSHLLIRCEAFAHPVID